MVKISRNIKLFAFDLDGTIYFGEEPAEGAIELVDYIKNKFHIVFFTNNSSKTRNEIHQKLLGLGIDCNVDNVYTTTSCTALFLLESKIDNIYVIGSNGLINELVDHGLNVIDSDKAENLLVGLDSNFNYKKIEIALNILLKNGKFIACNEDPSYPIKGNKFRPGCGAMVGSIRGATGKNPDYIVGKPNTFILSKIAESFHVNNDEIMVIGDSYESDIKMALNFKTNSILIGNNYKKYEQSVMVIENLHNVQQFIKEKYEHFGI